VHVVELAVVVTAISALFASAEALRRRGVSTAATRRYTHAAGATIASLLPAFLSLAEYLGLALVVAAVLSWTRTRGKLRSVHGVERPTLGAALFPLGLALAAVIGWEQPAAYGLGAMTFALADPAAAMIGDRVRSWRWAVWRGTKSLGGSLTFVGVTLLIGVLAAAGWPVGVGAILAAAIFLALVEGSLGFGLDNLALPPLAVLTWRAVLGL
jgi:phytol kinase